MHLESSLLAQKDRVFGRHVTGCVFSARNRLTLEHEHLGFLWLMDEHQPSHERFVPDGVKAYPARAMVEALVEWPAPRPEDKTAEGAAANLAVFLDSIEEAGAPPAGVAEGIAQKSTIRW